jgi:hypothetical protein
MGTWPPTPGRLVRSLLARITALADQVRAAVRREPRGRQLAWLAIAALLVMGPLGFNLARESGFEASRVILPRELGPYPAIHDPRYYRSLFADPVLREEMGSTAGGEVGDIDDVTIRSGPEPATLTVTVRAQTPERAQAFVNALGPQIAGATKRQLARVVTQDAATLRERLLGTSLSVGERRTLRGRLRRLEGNPKLQEPRVLLGPPAPMPPLERWADRVVDDLPGAFFARPNLAWAALAGLLVAAALWASSRVVLPCYPSVHGTARVSDHRHLERG